MRCPCASPNLLVVSRRLRRRGPRSLQAVNRRRRRHHVSHSEGSVSSNSDLPGGGCGEPQPEPSAIFVSPMQPLSCVSVNIRSLRAHSAELCVHLEKLQPQVLLITETWLDDSCGEFCIPGYWNVSRRDRSDGRCGGGVAVYGRNGFDGICFIDSSLSAELSWHIIHTDIGPVLFGAWYRAPDEKGFCQSPHLLMSSENILWTPSVASSLVT